MNANGFWRGLSPDGLSFSRAAITPQSYQVETKEVQHTILHQFWNLKIRFLRKASISIRNRSVQPRSRAKILKHIRSEELHEKTKPS